MKSLITLAAAAAMAIGTTTFAAALPSTSATTTYQRAQVDGVGIFYREAGPKDAPTIVLLHGFPSSSRMFDTLIPLLATRYHLIAPDYPGFGQSDAPSPAQYRYTFDHLAETTNALLEQLKIDRYFLYMQDYGGPVGFRIMVKHPERIRGIVVQNANAYKEGLGAKWTGIAQYWADPKAHPEIFKAFSSLEGAKQRHIAGSPHPERYNPDTWTDEYAILSRPDEQEIQADLLFDYQTNVASYPQWQAWLREHKPPTLVMWGRYDLSFLTPGALAFKRDVPDAEIHLLDATLHSTKRSMRSPLSRSTSSNDIKTDLKFGGWPRQCLVTRLIPSPRPPAQRPAMFPTVGTPSDEADARNRLSEVRPERPC